MGSTHDNLPQNITPLTGSFVVLAIYNNSDNICTLSNCYTCQLNQ